MEGVLVVVEERFEHGVEYLVEEMLHGKEVCSKLVRS